MAQRMMHTHTHTHAPAHTHTHTHMNYIYRKFTANSSMWGSLRLTPFMLNDPVIMLK